MARRISELSAQTGVTVPTIKYYLREGLLPEGGRTAPTQAAYGENHVERLRVIRALLDAGVCVAETRRLFAALNDPPESPHDLMGTAQAATTPAVDETLDLTDAVRLVEGLGWKSGMCDEAVLHAVARALQGLARAGFTVPHAATAEYVASMRRIADVELDGVPAESAEAAVRYVVLRPVLVEPLWVALRRVAQQVSWGSGSVGPGASFARRLSHVSWGSTAVLSSASLGYRNNAGRQGGTVSEYGSGFHAQDRCHRSGQTVSWLGDAARPRRGHASTHR